jgi:2-isopropylmalate synthase
MFWREYIERDFPWQLEGFETESRNGVVKCKARLLRDGQPVEFAGEGNGPLAALVQGFTRLACRVRDRELQRTRVERGETASAISYIQIKHADGKTRWGAGVDTNIELASVRAVLSALNRS